jgi:hypothetical protein
MAGRWDMSDQDRAQLRGAMEEAALAGTRESTDVGDLIEQLGGRRVAEILSGTTDHKSRAYRSQLRNVQRWRQGRSPAARTVQRLTSSRRTEAARKMRDAGSVEYTAEATWVTSRKPWRGEAHGTLSGRRLAAFADAIESGDYETAAEVMAGDYFGQEDIVAGVEDLGGITLGAGEGNGDDDDDE